MPHKGPVDVQRGERTAAAQRALAKSRLGAQAAIPETGDPVAGTFSPVLDWPLVGIHAVLLPDGRVLTYGTDLDGVQTGHLSTTCGIRVSDWVRNRIACSRIAP